MAVGRYAPSPTGTFHIGNLRTAALAWLIARSSGSAFLLRWEDLDVTADPTHEVTQQRDLAALGIDFDGTAMRQTERLDAYRDVLDQLRREDRLYRCWCSRKDIREATAAPHGRPGLYPGTCRDLTTAEIREHEATGRAPALRLRTDVAERTFVDRLAGETRGEVDDFVLERGDGTPAYNLAVVVDDAAQGVEEVVRGDDLLLSTARQAHLCDILGLPEPSWTHVPLCLDDAGDRLAKRDGSAGLDAWLAAGGTVPSLLREIGGGFGATDPEPRSLSDLLPHFDLDALDRRPARLHLGGDGPSDPPKLAIGD